MRSRLLAAGSIALLAAAGAGSFLVQRQQSAEATAIKAERLTGGDIDDGRAAIGRYGCGACHLIPGVPGAMGKVGPPLTGVASRAYVGGRLSNSAANIILWIQHPQQVSPGTGMPETGVTPADARDVAAYLYTLQ